MLAEPRFNRSERFRHESIIKIEDDLALSPYYAVSYNLSEAGMYFKSLFELFPGVHILIGIDDYSLSENQVPTKVVWCQKLDDSNSFRYGVGVELLQSEKTYGLRESLAITPQMKTKNSNSGGVVIKMEKRFTE